MHVEGDEREEDGPPPDNVIEDPLAADADTEDDWDLRDILSYGAIGVRSSLRGDLSTVQQKCRCTA